MKVYTKDYSEFVFLYHMNGIAKYRLGSVLSYFAYCNIDNIDSMLNDLSDAYKKNLPDKVKKLKKVADELFQINPIFDLYSSDLSDMQKLELADNIIIDNIDDMIKSLHEVRILQFYVNELIENVFLYVTDKNVDAAKTYEKIISTPCDIDKSYKFNLNIKNVQYSFNPNHDYPESTDDIFVRDKTELCPLINPSTVSEAIYFLIAQAFVKKAKFKICGNCHRYYATTGLKNSEYCDRIANDIGQTCVMVGSTKKYTEDRKTDPVKRVYTKAYNARNARVRYGSVTKKEFTTWASKARDKRFECQQGLISLEELESWLRDDSFLKND